MEQRTIFKCKFAIIYVIYCCWLFPFCVVGQRKPTEKSFSVENIDWNSRDDKEFGSRIITVHLSETPTFLCTEDDPSICTARVHAEQQRVIEEFEKHIPGISVVATAGKIINSIFFRLPPTNQQKQHEQQPQEQQYDKSSSTLSSSLKNSIYSHKIDGIKEILPHSFYTPSLRVNENIPLWGGVDIDEKFCATGRGIKIAVLDTGIDYTHRDLGGKGTRLAYRDAYGDNAASEKDKRRDDLFPTKTVLEGYDFVGETSFLPFLLQGDIDLGDKAQPDDDPIDEMGHGTLVSSHVLKVAPDAKFVAVKVCSDICPSFALVLGIEFALDPNQDGSTDDAVDIINMSLGIQWDSALSRMETLVIERAFSLGVLTVIAAGNNKNIAYIGGGFGKSPHAITVAASGPPTSVQFKSGFVKSYSSRYPGENNAIKPDIAARDGYFGALAKSGFRHSVGIGTSFSTAIITGSAALIKERCTNCSPLALKALLMNNAFRDIRYNVTSSEKAPISLVGSGEVQINKSLDADFWAYDTTSVQPSLSLGLIDANSSTTIRRSIKVISLTDATEVITVDSIFRDINDEESGAVSISINPKIVTLSDCQEVIVDLDFYIDASKAPDNYFGHSRDPKASAFELDKNEFDGHITLTSTKTGKDIALPFHLLLRKVSHTIISSNQNLPWKLNEKSSTTFEITNNGAGVAQIDAFNLIAVSPDDPEGAVGEPLQADFRSIGFRSRHIDWQGCSSVFEFAINTWERHDHFNPIGIVIFFDTDRDGEKDYELHFNRNLQNEIRITSKDRTICNHLSHDDASNTANTIIRICSEDIGDPDIFNAAFVLTSPHSSLMNLPDSYFSEGISTSFMAPSHDIAPGGVLNFTVSGLGTGTGPLLDQRPFGLQIITNANRGAGKTGASTPETETHLLMVEGLKEFDEVTPDKDHVFQVAEDTTGPQCSWKTNACDGTPTPTQTMDYPPSVSPAPTVVFTPRPPLPTNPPSCEIEELPKEEVPRTTASPTSTASSTSTVSPTSTDVVATNQPTESPQGPSSGYARKQRHSTYLVQFLAVAFIGYI